MSDKASTKIINDDQVAENNKALRDLLSLATQSLPLNEILGNCLDVLLSLRWLSLLPKAGIFLTRKGIDGVDYLHLVAERNIGDEIKTLCSKIKFGQCLCGKAAQTKITIHASCLDKNHELTFDGMPPHGHYNVPILLKGRVLGVIVFYLPHGTKRKDEDVDFLERIADTLSLIITVRETEKELNEKVREMTFQSQAVDEHLMVSTTDVTGIITGINDKFCDFTGYSREELLGQNHRIIKSDHHSKEFYKDMWNTILSGQTWHGNICNEKKDGSIYWVKSSIVPFLDAQGKPYKYVASRTDITNLRAREERLHRSHVFAKMGMWGWDIKTGELTWPELTGPLCGFEEDTTICTNIEFLALIHDEDRSMVIKLINKCIIGGTAYTAEHRMVWPDGSIHWVQSSGNVTRDAAGKPLHMLGMIQDIDQRKSAELALRETEKQMVLAKEEAEKANQAKSEFLSSMSHELRTPMNSIIGFGQILESNSKEPLTDTQNKCVQHIMKSGEHLLELINQVLDLSQIEAGHMKLSIENVDITKMIEDCLSSITPTADKHNISLHISPFPETFVKADIIRLKQVMLNLLSNAVKYNREGGSVSLKISQNDDRICILINDTGIGIPEDRQSEIFQPFNRLGAENLKVEGTGIGLNISRKIINLMEGNIGFESILGEGSSFWIDLPKTNNLPSMNKNVTQEEKSNLIDMNTSGRILYIEDNPANLKLMEMIIKKMSGLSLLSAHNGELGVDLAASEQLDLIILDINLPGMNGFAVMEHLKGNEKTRHIPVIALSANVMPADIERGRQIGFAHYLTKPLDIDKVMRVIGELIKEKSS